MSSDYLTEARFNQQSQLYADLMVTLQCLSMGGNQFSIAEAKRAELTKQWNEHSATRPEHTPSKWQKAKQEYDNKTQVLAAQMKALTTEFESLKENVNSLKIKLVGIEMQLLSQGDSAVIQAYLPLAKVFSGNGAGTTKKEIAQAWIELVHTIRNALGYPPISDDLVDAMVLSS